MDQFAWVDPLFESVKKILKGAWALVMRWPVAIPLAIAVIALLFDVGDALHRSYVTHYEKHFTVYVGPQGSSSNYTGRHVQDVIEKVSAAPGTNFHSAVIPLTSSTDVYDRVLADTDGRSIGVAADKTKDVDGIRTLLPLDWEYLHILANVKFLDRICRDQPTDSAKTAPPRWPSEFSEVVGKLKYGRVYCDGGSKDLATELIDRCWASEGKGLGYFLSPAILNWDAAIAALQEDQLDVLFFTGRLGATTVKTIAQDRTAVLLGLNDLATALKRDYEPTLILTSFPTNSYSETPFRVNNLLPVDFHFCGAELATVATRRLIVVSHTMNDNDAYLISAALSNGLSQDDGQPDDPWKRLSPDNPQSLASGEHAPFGIAPHSGAIAALHGLTVPTVWDPRTWSTWAKALAAAVLTFFVTKALRWYSKSDIQQNDAAAVVTKPTSQADQQTTLASTLKAKIEAIEADLRELAPPIASSKKGLLRERIAILMAEIRHNLQDRKISLDEAESLLNGIEGLYDDLGQLDDDQKHPEKTTSPTGTAQHISSESGLLLSEVMNSAIEN